MDLSKIPPRSVRALFADVVMLGRTTDKARGTLAGTADGYQFNCPMDQAVFAFLGIDHEAYLAKAKELDNEQLETWAREHVTSRKTTAERAHWNDSFVNDSPQPGSESEADFLEMRASSAPDRRDVTTWSDLLDLSEGRDVPRRQGNANR